MSPWQNSPSVFTRDAKHAGLTAIGNDQLVTKRGREQVAWRDTLVAFGIAPDDVMAIVFGVVNKFPRRAVDPVVGNNPVTASVTT